MGYENTLHVIVQVLRESEHSDETDFVISWLKYFEFLRQNYN
jgi:hypothetical protein